MKKAISGFLAMIMALVMAAGSFQSLALTAAAVSAPAAPQNIMAVSATYSSVKVSWSAVTGAAGYEVYRYNPVTKQFQRLVSAKAVTYTSTGLTTGKAYTFKARAYKTVSGKNTYGGYSKTVAAKPVPAVPGAFKAASTGITSIKLSWNTVSGASGYVIYRYDTAAITYKQYKITTALNFSDTGLTTGMTYLYKIRAYRTVGKVNVFSGYTAPLSATPIPAAPGNVTFTVLSATSIQINWNAVTGASGYNVYGYNPVTKISTLIQSTQLLNYTVTGIAADTTIYYNVRAYKTVNTVTVLGEYSQGSVGQILNSGKYTISFDGQIDNGGTSETVPITLYASGNKIAMKTVMDMTKQGYGQMKVTFLSTGTKYYAIMPSMKVYFSLPADVAQELFQGFLNNNDPNTKYMGTAPVTYNSVNYLCELYSDGSTTTECFIKDGQLKRMVMTDSTGTNTMENMSLSAAVDASVFVIPVGYMDVTSIVGNLLG